MFRFTIRDLLWLMVVMGLACAVWADRTSVNAERSALRTERESVAAKKRELDTQFLRLVDATDQLNNQQAKFDSAGGRPQLPRSPTP